MRNTGGEIKTFQVIVLGIFGFFIIAGVIAFATFRGSGKDVFQPVSVWGTIDAGLISDFVRVVEDELEVELPINYREIREKDFDRELVEALAAGRGPDMILLPQDLIVRHEDKIFVIPFESLSQRDFRDRFIEEGELYMRSDGILGLPLSVDPLVLYWNRTIFSNAGLSQPPAFWDEFATLTSRLTQIDERGNILQSAIALGEFSNVDHAKEIFVSLVLQAGNGVTERLSDDQIDIIFSERLNLPEAPAESALRFYTEFANPVKLVYSWNRSLPQAEEAFLVGDLAMYIGFASELPVLAQKNSNLNFDVAPLPQVRGTQQRVTFGNMHALAILKSSPNVGSGFSALRILTDTRAISIWKDVSGLPPVRRDLLATPPTDAYGQVFYDGAIISDAFLDPDPQESESIFSSMVDDVTSGRAGVSNAVGAANRLLENILR